MRNDVEIGLALAGGGSKAFYSLGVCTYLYEQGLRYRSYAGTSAGSAMTVADAIGNHRDVFGYFLTLVRNNPKNFYWRRLLAGQSPFPHLRMYKAGIRHNLDFARLTELINEGVRFRVPAVVIRPTKYGKPDRTYYRASLMAYLAFQYFRDKRGLKKEKFQNYLQKNAANMNLSEIIFTEKDFTSPEMIEKIVLVSSSAPPILKTQKLGNHYLLDGALNTNLPVAYLGDVDLRIGIVYHANSAAFYMRQFPDALIFAPSKELSLQTFEYADVNKITEAFDLGYSDGADFYKVIAGRIRTIRKKRSLLYKARRALLRRTS